MNINTVTGGTREELKPCPVRPELHERELLSDDQSIRLEEFFRLMGNRTRLKILHTLVKEGELCVGDIAKRIEMQSQVVSNQLKQLSDRASVASRRDGNNIYYRVTDRCVIDLLDRALCHLECIDERMEQES